MTSAEDSPLAKMRLRAATTFNELYAMPCEIYFEKKPRRPPEGNKYPEPSGTTLKDALEYLNNNDLQFIAQIHVKNGRKTHKLSGHIIDYMIQYMID